MIIPDSVSDANVAARRAYASRVHAIRAAVRGTIDWSRVLRAQAVITDPFPNGRIEAGVLPTLLRDIEADRVVVVVDATVDPRLLDVPTRWPFLQPCWLRYERPRATGGVMVSADVAYVFGEPLETVVPVEAALGQALECDSKGRPRKRRGRQRPHRFWRRPLAHLRWLVGHWCPTGLLIDPRAGNGEILTAAAWSGIAAMGDVEDEAALAVLADRVREVPRHLFDTLLLPPGVDGVGAAS